MSRRRRVLTAAAVVAVAILGFYAFVLASFHAQLSGTALEPTEIFETLIARPIPVAVSDLQAVASSGMQGYQAFARFRVASLGTVGLDRDPYEAADCDRIRLYLNLPARIRSPFSPEWELPESGECLKASGLENAWAAEAMNHVLFQQGWVYFTSSGD